MLGIILLLSLTAFSQTDTNKDTCRITIPCSTANKIAADLLSGDLAKAELQQTQEILKITNNKVEEFSAITQSYETKVSAFKKEIMLYDEKETTYKSIITGLEDDNKKIRRRIKILGVTIGVTGVAAAIGFLIH